MALAFLAEQKPGFDIRGVQRPDGYLNQNAYQGNFFRTIEENKKGAKTNFPKTNQIIEMSSSFVNPYKQQAYGMGKEIGDEETKRKQNVLEAIKDVAEASQ